MCQPCEQSVGSLYPLFSTGVFPAVVATVLIYAYLLLGDKLSAGIRRQTKKNT